MLNRNEIKIRDPFIVVENDTYYMFGTTDNCWEYPASSFSYYKSIDLEHFDGPYTAFERSQDFWADMNFWAPEVHRYAGKYYMFATFYARDKRRRRGTQILASDTIQGPYLPISDSPVTPAGWECLDGTLFLQDGKPYLVFCHEWLQVFDGTICAMELSSDLTAAISKPTTLFSASEAGWPASHEKKDDKPCYVTDGPFFYTNSKNELIMLWSSFHNGKYAIGQSISKEGLFGPWKHIQSPLYSNDGGHGMVFETLDNRLMLSIHKPNTTPYERAEFIELIENNGILEVK